MCVLGKAPKVSDPVTMVWWTSPPMAVEETGGKEVVEKGLIAGLTSQLRRDGGDRWSPYKCDNRCSQIVSATAG